MGKKVSTDSIRRMAKEIGMDDSKIIEINGLEIEIKSYLPIEKKREIAIIVNENSFLGKGDLKLYDKAIEEIMLNSLIILNYTNINGMKDYFEFYDCLKSTKMLDTIIDYIDKTEIEEVKKLVESRKEDNYRLQELRGLMGYKLEDLFSIINDKLKEVQEVVSEFDPSLVQELMGLADIGKDNPTVKEDKIGIEDKIKDVENKVLAFTPKSEVENEEVVGNKGIEKE